MADIGGANRKGETLTVNSGNGYVLITTATDGHGYSLQINGVLGASKYGQYIYSNAIQVNSPLQRIHSDNASSTANLAEYLNDGTGTTLLVQTDGVLASNRYGLHVYTNAVQVNSYLVVIHSDNASSTADLFTAINDGTGTLLSLQQNGALAANKHGLYLYSNGANTNSNSSFLAVHLDNASSTQPLGYFINDGTGTGLIIEQNGILATDQFGLFINSSAAQVNAALFKVQQSNASASQLLAHFVAAGTGPAIRIDKASGYENILIVQSYNSADPCWGIRMNLANAGAGLEYAFRFDGSEIVVAAVGGAQSHKIRASIAGTDFFIPCYTA